MRKFHPIDVNEAQCIVCAPPCYAGVCVICVFLCMKKIRKCECHVGNVMESKRNYSAQTPETQTAIWRASRPGEHTIRWQFGTFVIHSNRQLNRHCLLTQLLSFVFRANSQQNVVWHLRSTPPSSLRQINKFHSIQSPGREYELEMSKSTSNPLHARRNSHAKSTDFVHQ